MHNLNAFLWGVGAVRIYLYYTFQNLVYYSIISGWVCVCREGVVGGIKIFEELRWGMTLKKVWETLAKWYH